MRSTFKLPNSAAAASLLATSLLRSLRTQKKKRPPSQEPRAAPKKDEGLFNRRTHPRLQLRRSQLGISKKEHHGQIRNLNKKRSLSKHTKNMATWRRECDLELFQLRFLTVHARESKAEKRNVCKEAGHAHNEGLSNL